MSRAHDAAPSGSCASLFACIQDALSRLVGLRPMAETLGGNVCLVYLEGAAEALRTARDVAAAEVVDREAEGLPDGVVALPSLGVALRATGRGALAERGVLMAGAAGVVFLAQGDDAEGPGSPAPDLGAALFASGAARDYVRRPVSAALLADALAAHEWIHVESGETWSAGWDAAMTLVAAMAGGRTFAPTPAGATRSLVDLAAAELLHGLGWRRLQGPRL